MVDVGDKAPDFTLQSTKRKSISLSTYRGKKNVVLFFFPLAFTPVCELELPLLERAYPQFKQLDAEVLGISVDANPTQAAFARHCGVESFPLLSDIHRQVSREYGVLRPERISERATFVIDKRGFVRWKQVASLDTRRDIDEVLEALRRIAGAGG